MVWNIGKIWLRFFTDVEIQIKYYNQEKINKIVDRNVFDIKINNLIKRLLTWHRKERITFEEFLEDNFFIKKED